MRPSHNGQFNPDFPTTQDRTFSDIWSVWDGLRNGLDMLTHLSTMGTTTVSPNVTFARLNGTSAPAYV